MKIRELFGWTKTNFVYSIRQFKLDIFNFYTFDGMKDEKYEKQEEFHISGFTKIPYYSIHTSTQTNISRSSILNFVHRTTQQDRKMNSSCSEKKIVIKIKLCRWIFFFPLSLSLSLNRPFSLTHSLFSFLLATACEHWSALHSSVLSNHVGKMNVRTPFRHSTNHL